MEFYVEAGPKTRRFIEAVLPSMLTQLGLNSSRKFLMVKMDRDLKDHGTTMPMAGIDTVLIVLKPNRNLLNLGVTLAHELVHVRQLAKGQLKYLTKQNRIWMGRRYTKKTRYLDQPWEQDAFARQEIIVRRAIA